ncbi:hypothetical protein C2G38_2191879 [Gigaspora rosea]|uniref:Uncharacterized protein n=1 Tax=Gigaspora rosea TaxID=44941 RepID=A0A397V0Z2_9GLOM|nr:hypothetical protein C2G38_2191879 [Gigaspora rosea]
MSQGKRKKAGSSYPWSQRKLCLANPFPRYGHSSSKMASANDLLIFGGVHMGKARNDVFSVEINTLNVQSISTMGDIPSPRSWHTHAEIGSKMFVFGGLTQDPQTSEQRIDDNLYMLDIVTKRWSRISVNGTAPIGRYGHSAAVIGSKMYIFGGRFEGYYLNDLLAFDVNTFNSNGAGWEFITPTSQLPPGRMAHITCVHNDKIYVFGGNDAHRCFNDMWCFDPRTNTWSELSCIGFIPSARKFHGAAIVDDVMYIFGGMTQDGQELGDLTAFRISNQRWYMFQKMGPAPNSRFHPTMTTIQERVIVLGGESSQGMRPDEDGLVHILDTSKIKYPSVTQNTNPQQVQQGHPPQQQQQVAVQRNQQEFQQYTGFPLPPMTEHNRSTPSPTTVPGVSANQQVYSRGPNTPPNRSINSSPRIGGPNAQIDIDPMNNSRVSTPEQVTHMDRVNRSNSPQTRNMDNHRKQPPSPAGGIRQLQSKQSMERLQMNPSPTGPQQLTSQHIENINYGVQPPLDNKSNLQVYPSNGFRHGDFTNPRPAPQPGSSSPIPPNHSPNLKGSSASVSPAFSTTSTLPQGQLPHDGSSISSPTSTMSSMDIRSPTSDAVDHSLARILNTENGEFMNELQERDMNLAAFKKREMWLRAELALARKAGYTPEVDVDGGVPDGIDIDNLMEISEYGSEKYKIIEAITKIKQELRKAKATIANQAQIASQKITDSERVRTAALQEAAYFKAKLSALTNSSEHDLKILEVERATDLEKRLTRALTDKEAVQNQLIQLQQSSNYDKNSREAAEERARVATSRAEEAEEAHARALAELATLHSRATAAESQHRETKSQLSELNLELTRTRGNSSSQIQSLQQSVEQHQRALEKANIAIAAANERASEAESLWRQARQDISNLEKEAAGLRSELDLKMRDLDRASARATEMERLLDKTRQERDAVRDMMKDGMTKLLNNSRPNEELSVPTRVSSQVIHLEQEIETLKNINTETKESAEKASASLAIAMDKIVQLESALTKARSETAMLQRRLAESSDEVIRTKGRLREKERTLDEKTCALEDAEIKVGMMRDVMVERGILEDVTSQGTLSSQYKELLVRCEELEQRAQHEEDKKKLLEEELKRVNNSRSFNQDSSSSRNNDIELRDVSETQQKLQLAQDKLAKVESDYNTAMHYVQGTEKMLRRLKDELQKSKSDSDKLQKQLKVARERNEELEEKLSEVQNQASVRKGVRESKLQEFANKQLEVQKEEFGVEMTEVQQKMKDLIVQIDHAREEKKMVDISYEALRKEFKTMQKDHIDLKQSNKLLQEQLAASISKVEQLKKELDNSLVLNDRLNKQLSDDTNDNLSTNGKFKHHDKWDEQRGALERQIAQLHETNKRLERENLDFEQKLHESENKISLLLDQMEHAVDNYRVIEDGIKSSPRNSNIISSMTDKLDEELYTLNSRWGNMNHDDVDPEDDVYINRNWNRFPDNESRASSNIDEYENMIAALEHVQKVAAANRK